MIKIEITEPHKENPDILVKIAGLLMDLAGHKLVKAPETYTPTNYTPPTFEDLAESVDAAIDLIKVPDYTGVSQLNPPKELPVAYKHCSESDLTNAEHESLMTDEKKKPKSRKKTNEAVSTPDAPIPPLNEAPVVTCNTVIDKITDIMTNQKLSHDVIMAMIRKHGLANLKEVITRPDLAVAINNDLDAALGGANDWSL